MLTNSTLKQTVLVGFVVCVLAAACSSNDGRGEQLVSPDTTVAETTTTDDTTGTTDDGHDEPVATYLTVEVHDDEDDHVHNDDGSITAVETTTTTTVVVHDDEDDHVHNEDGSITGIVVAPVATYPTVTPETPVLVEDWVDEPTPTTSTVAVPSTAAYRLTDDGYEVTKSSSTPGWMPVTDDSEWLTWVGDCMDVSDRTPVDLAWRVCSSNVGGMRAFALGHGMDQNCVRTTAGPMSTSGDFTVDAVVKEGRFVGVVLCSGRIVWSGEAHTTKKAALAEAQQHMPHIRAIQDDRDSQQFTMDLAAGMAEPSPGDDWVLGL